VLLTCALPASSRPDPQCRAELALGQFEPEKFSGGTVKRRTAVAPIAYRAWLSSRSTIHACDPSAKATIVPSICHRSFGACRSNRLHSLGARCCCATTRPCRCNTRWIVDTTDGRAGPACTSFGCRVRAPHRGLSTRSFAINDSISDAVRNGDVIGLVDLGCSAGAPRTTTVAGIRKTTAGISHTGDRPRRR